jgi:hypothetical protein
MRDREVGAGASPISSTEKPIMLKVEPVNVKSTRRGKK